MLKEVTKGPTLHGEPVKLEGRFPEIGKAAPPFLLVDKDLKDTTLAGFGAKRKVLNIVPSLDTPVCQASARRFNQEASNLSNTVVINISADLPFAQQRFCASEGLNNVVNLSTMRGREFMRNYGVQIAGGNMAGLCARAVVILDGKNMVRYTEMVPQIEHEPDYDAALKALQAI